MVSDDGEDLSLEPVLIDPNEQPQAYVLAVLNNALPAAADTISKAANRHDSVDRLSYDAAKYVIEYVMGGGLAKGKDGAASATPEDMLKAFRQEMGLLPTAEGHED